MIDDQVRKEMLKLLNEDEVQLIDAYRSVKFGSVTVNKKDNQKVGRITIQTTY